MVHGRPEVPASLPGEEVLGHSTQSPGPTTQSSVSKVASGSQPQLQVQDWLLPPVKPPDMNIDEPCKHEKRLNVQYHGEEIQVEDNGFLPCVPGCRDGLRQDQHADLLLNRHHCHEARILLCHLSPNPPHDPKLQNFGTNATQSHECQENAYQRGVLHKVAQLVRQGHAVRPPDVLVTFQQ